MTYRLKTGYEAPTVEMVEAEVEKGFAGSAGISGWGDGGSQDGSFDI